MVLAPTFMCGVHSFEGITMFTNHPFSRRSLLQLLSVVGLSAGRLAPTPQQAAATPVRAIEEFYRAEPITVTYALAST